MPGLRKHRLPDVGDRHGRLTVLGPAVFDAERSVWDIPVECTCGNQLMVRHQRWVSGWTRSCGCLRDDTTVARSTTHGQTRTTLYSRWANMVQRCTNPNRADYNTYGGRGITICEAWMEFDNFLLWAETTFEKGLTLDRIDNDGPYSPENCRWVPHQTNCRNRSNSVTITAWGETKTPIDWLLDPRCKVSGYKPLMQRVRKLGWPPEDAIGQPPFWRGNSATAG